ncbi:chaperonin 10-like protein [Schizophyllum commune]
MSALPETIKALQILPDKTGVQVVTIPWASQEKVQNLADNEIVVRVRAVGLNPTDWKHVFRVGKAGTIAGCDAAGDVVKVGSAVKHLKVGDRTAAFTYGSSWQTDNGAFAEYARFNAAVAFKLPEDMTYEEAASFPIPHLTAVQALYMRLGVPKPFTTSLDEKILIWGGSSAVGHHAVQLAKLSGLTVFVTGSPAVWDELKSLGADFTFDYKDPDIVSKIHAAAGPDGIIHGLDTIAGGGTVEKTIDAMSKTRGGKVITTLQISEEVAKRRADVSAEFTLVYTEIGREIVFGSGQRLPAMPEDEARALDYVANDQPKVLEGWKAGQGAPTFKAQRLRKLHGLENIQEGLKIMAEGNYGREKLVYTIA